MVLDITLIIITFIVLLTASYTDLKTREVPDWLSYGFIIAAVGIRSIFSLEWGWFVLISGLLGLALCFGLACLFYYTHQWGGGDSKLLMGMGAAIGITYPLVSSSLNIVWFFLALLFIGAFYGLVWMLLLAVKKKKIFLPAWRETLHMYRTVHWGIIVLTILLVLLSTLYPFFWPLVFFPAGVFYLFLFVNIIERTCFIKRVAVSTLTEGDWLAERIVAGTVTIPTKTLEAADVRALHRLHTTGKVKQVLIKEGIPFVPSFLLAYAALIIFTLFGSSGWLF